MKKNKYFRRWKSGRLEKQMKKKHSSYDTSYIIECRLPNIGDITTRYEIPEIVQNLFFNADAVFSEMLSKLEANDLNETYLDQYILTVNRIGISDPKTGIEEQRLLHTNVRLSIIEELEYQLHEKKMMRLADQEFYEELRRELEKL